MFGTSYSITRNILKLIFLNSINKEITAKNSAQGVEQAIWVFALCQLSLYAIDENSFY